MKRPVQIRERGEPNFVTAPLANQPIEVNAFAVAYRVNVLATEVYRLSIRLSNLERQLVQLERLVAGHKAMIVKLKRA